MGVTAVTKLHFYLAPMNYPLKADISRPLTAHITGMCGRDTYKPAWEEIVALCRLTLGLPAGILASATTFALPRQSTRSLCLTTTAGLSECAGLIPSWWSKPLKEM
jgi:hypothetical protein